MFNRQQRRSAPLGAAGKPLQDPKRRQRRRRQHTRLGIGGQCTDHRGGHPHEQQRTDKDGLAPHPVPQVPGDHGSHRARAEAGRIGGKRGQRACRRRDAREEQRLENQRRGRRVEIEVVPLDRGADHATQRDRARRGRVPVSRTARMDSRYRTGGSHATPRCISGWSTGTFALGRISAPKRHSQKRSARMSGCESSSGVRMVASQVTVNVTEASAASSVHTNGSEPIAV
ncbi:Uncharacterised protein [Mycobacteroides abscessus]|nr:Uncharacterised protein [Mycobacteroides abscessus]